MVRDARLRSTGSEALEEFNHPQHLVHTLIRRAAAREFMSDIRVPDIFNRTPEDFQRSEQHFSLRNSGT